MTNEITQKDTIIDFLKEIAVSVENDSITDRTSMLLHDFFIATQFNNELCKQDDLSFDEKDLIRYMFLGWYIYNNILTNKSNKDKRE